MPIQTDGPVALIGAALGWGAQLHETEQGPDQMRARSLAEILEAAGLDATWREMLYPKTRAAGTTPLRGPATLPLVTDFVQRLAPLVEATVHAGQFPVVIGGDHSLAIGTWGGIARAYEAHSQMGLLWIDAHMDAHTPMTSPSQAYHGMPVACLLGHGEKTLAHLTSPTPVIKPEHLVLFGVRSYEAGEEHLLTRLGVRIFYMQEIRDRGVEVCAQEALAILNTAPKGFGVSVDLDAFDPEEAPGVGSPAPHGLFFDATRPLFEALSHQKKLLSFEIVEYNPIRDQNARTAQLIEKITTILLRNKRRLPHENPGLSYA